MRNVRDYSGAYVLRLIRDGICPTWKDLCLHFFGNTPTSDVMQLAAILVRLFSQNLVEYKTQPHAPFGIMGALSFNAEGVDEINDPLQVTQTCYDLQNALGISLSTVASLGPPGSSIVRPIFGKATEQQQPSDVFILMPFSPELRPIYEDHLAPVVARMGRTVQRGDDCFATGSVMAEIWTAIAGARILVADCTGRNPNVFYEIGVAHTIGKPVILITQILEDVPFDLRHMRFIKYEFTPRGMAAFEKTLETTLRYELDETRESELPESGG